MKKILLAFDGVNFSEGAFEFVRKLNEMNPVLVTGVFMPQLDYANLWSYAGVSSVGGLYIPLLEKEDVEVVSRNIAHFESLCRENDIAYRVHKEFIDFALPELKKESRFADVLIIAGELFYNQARSLNQSEYLRDALHESECPVIIVPENYQFPDNNIIAYNGTEQSVFALKQFAYIFPELAKNSTLLVFAEEESKAIPERECITELVAQHYPNLSLHKLEIEKKKFFNTWLSEKEGSILISGSFSRSALSNAFKKSFVADVIRDHKLPVFIAHK